MTSRTHEQNTMFSQYFEPIFTSCRPLYSLDWTMPWPCLGHKNKRLDSKNISNRFSSLSLKIAALIVSAHCVSIFIFLFSFSLFSAELLLVWLPLRALQEQLAMFHETSQGLLQTLRGPFQIQKMQPEGSAERRGQIEETHPTNDLGWESTRHHARRGSQSFWGRTKNVSWLDEPAGRVAHASLTPGN